MPCSNIDLLEVVPIFLEHIRGAERRLLAADDARNLEGSGAPTNHQQHINHHPIRLIKS